MHERLEFKSGLNELCGSMEHLGLMNVSQSAMRTYEGVILGHGIWSDEGD